MKEVAISEFKAKCLGILEEVRKTRKPIRVTRFGKPVAEVFQHPRRSLPEDGSGPWPEPSNSGGIVGPTSSSDEWDAAR